VAREKEKKRTWLCEHERGGTPRNREKRAARVRSLASRKTDTSRWKPAARAADHRASFPPVDKACVDELIEKCCRPESMGQVYRFLLQAFDYDASLARAEFDAFMRGTLSERARTAAERATEADRYEEPGVIRSCSRYVGRGGP
jgi:hypothetical protein